MQIYKKYIDNSNFSQHIITYLRSKSRINSPKQPSKQFSRPIIVDYSYLCPKDGHEQRDITHSHTQYYLKHHGADYGHRGYDDCGAHGRGSEQHRLAGHWRDHLQLHLLELCLYPYGDKRHHSPSLRSWR